MNDLPAPVRAALVELSDRSSMERKIMLRTEAVVRARAALRLVENGEDAGALELFAVACGFVTAAMREAA